MIKLSDLARQHCGAIRPALNLRGMVQLEYGITLRSLQLIAAGKRNASAQFLARLNQAHVRLFPDQPVTLSLPNHPPVLLGDHSNN